MDWKQQNEASVPVSAVVRQLRRARWRASEPAKSLADKILGRRSGVTDCETRSRWCDRDPLLAAYTAVVLNDGDCSYFLLGWELWFTVVAGIPMVRK